MKSIEKNKAQKIVDKIQSGMFDENDVDLLFLKLRAYSSGYPIFREVSDFVAHNDNRDRGIANKSLETMYLSVMFFLEYTSPKKNLDIGSPFPLWIKKLIKLQVDKSDPNTLKEKFNVTKDRLKSRIDNGFKDNKKNKTTLLKNGKLSQETLLAIQHVLSFISGNHSFTQKDLIGEVISVIKSNDIKIDDEKFHVQSDKVTLCTLLLFHRATFDFKGHKAGMCQISSEKSSISYNTRFVDADGNEVENNETYGNLQIGGTVILDKDGKDLSIGHTVMSTDLKVDDWCEDSLFVIEPFSDQTPQLMCKRVKLDNELSISGNFKLTQIVA